MTHILGSLSRRVMALLLLILAFTATAVVAVVGVGPPIPFALIMVGLTLAVARANMKTHYYMNMIGAGSSERVLKWRGGISSYLRQRPKIFHTAWPLLN